MNKTVQQNFIDGIILRNVQSASFVRGHVYAPGSTQEQRTKFVRGFKAALAALEPYYTTPVSDEAHYQTIEKFADEVSAKYPQALRNGRLRIGTAQKAVNLFLKFLWSLGRIPEPPHCPVDSVVLQTSRSDVAWTQFDSIAQYRAIIKALRQVAGEQSLAVWECALWDSRAENE